MVVNTHCLSSNMIVPYVLVASAMAAASPRAIVFSVELFLAGCTCIVILLEKLSASVTVKSHVTVSFMLFVRRLSPWPVVRCTV